MSNLGIELHEVQDVGTSFSGLGWNWQLCSQSKKWLMICTQEKFDLVNTFLEKRSDPKLSSWSLETVRKAAGILNWISEAGQSAELT